MKERGGKYLFIALGAALICSIWISARMGSARISNSALLTTTFCDKYGDGVSSSGWHVVIYIDVEACLACTEDMDSWRELERRLDECGGMLSLWTSRADSIDVFWAMKLEGLVSPVRVLEDSVIAALDWGKWGTPVKVLLDRDCQIVKIAGRMGNTIESEFFIRELMDKICSVKIPNAKPEA